MLWSYSSQQRDGLVKFHHGTGPSVQHQKRQDALSLRVFRLHMQEVNVQPCSIRFNCGLKTISHSYVYPFCVVKSYKISLFLIYMCTYYSFIYTYMFCIFSTYADKFERLNRSRMRNLLTSNNICLL